VHFAGPADARAAGIEVVHQDLALCDNLSAAANLFLGRECTRSLLGFARRLDHPAMEREARRMFEELGADVPPTALVSRLSGGQRQAIAIARCLLAEARVVLMDEPTAAIGARQVQEVLERIRQLRERGTAVLLISHRLSDVFAVCDDVAVLCRGSLVAHLACAETTPERITGLMTGAIEAA